MLLSQLLTHHIGKCAHDRVGHSVWHELHHCIKVSHPIEAHTGKATSSAVKTEATEVRPLHIVLCPLLVLTHRLLLLLHFLLVIIRLFLTNTTVTSRLCRRSSRDFSTRRLGKISHECFLIWISSFTSIDSCGMSLWASVGMTGSSVFELESTRAWGGWDTSRNPELALLLSTTACVEDGAKVSEPCGAFT